MAPAGCFLPTLGERAGGFIPDWAIPGRFNPAAGPLSPEPAAGRVSLLAPGCFNLMAISAVWSLEVDDTVAPGLLDSLCLSN